MTTDGGISPLSHISVTALTTYFQCPRKYQHRYVLQTPPAFRPCNLALGSAVHTALAHFYACHLGDKKEPTTAEISHLFVDAWQSQVDGPTPVLFLNDDTPDSLKDQGVALVQVFLEKAQRPQTVIAVEEDFCVEVLDPETGEPGPPLVGKLDAVVEQANGDLIVLEHKTASRRFSETRLRWDLQATAYSLATHLMGLETQVIFQVLIKNKPALEMYNAPRTSLDHRYFLAAIFGVVRGVQVGAFPPVRDWWCKGCPFAMACLSH